MTNKRIAEILQMIKDRFDNQSVEPPHYYMCVHLNYLNKVTIIEMAKIKQYIYDNAPIDIICSDTWYHNSERIKREQWIDKHIKLLTNETD